MEDRNRATGNSSTRVIVRVVLYYIVLLGAGWALLDRIPRMPSVESRGIEALFGLAPPGAAGVQPSGVALDQYGLSFAVMAAMVASILLSIPVAWVYLLTRAKRGYQQSVVQLLIILPLVVAGIVVLVKYSLALAFSLAGIVAAVRFRNTLDDSKDAVYVFLATGIGLAAAVNIPVAAVISVIFNATMLVLWATDFGRAPVALDGVMAERRLKQAEELARTGTFVAQLDKELFRDMTKEQLEGVAQRAWKRAHENEPDSGESPGEIRLRITTIDAESMRAALEPQLTEQVKRWTLNTEENIPDGDLETVCYSVKLRRKGTAEEVESLVRAAASPWIVSVEVE